MIEVYSRIFEELDSNNVFYCSWKSNDRLSEFLQGKDDLDLYVSYKYKKHFEKILLSFDFVRVDSYVASFPYIQHYIGIDNETNTLVHLHVYFKIVTGESNTKNYILPLDSWIKRNVSYERDIPTLTHEAQLVIYLIRYLIKIGSLSGLLLYFRDFKKYKNEINSIEKVLARDLPPFISDSMYLEIYDVVLKGSFWGKLKASVKLKRSIALYKRMARIEHLSYKAFSFIKRLFNKLTYKKKKILSEGVLVGVCGLDGSGKSSAVDGLKSFYSSKFSTEVIHIGRPMPTLITFPFWLLFRLVERFRHSRKNENTSIESHFPSETVGIISAFRYVILAYERYCTSKKAQKLCAKGYIVISDRYPTMDYGKMDSPRILYREDMNLLYSYLHYKELELYTAIVPSDLVLHLSVPTEVAIERNRNRVKFGKETDNEIRARYLVNSGVRFKTDCYYHIDATREIDDVKADLISKVWSHI